MAGIRARKKADGTNTYQVTVRVAGQEAMRKSFDDREQAKRWGEVATVTARHAVHPIANTKDYRKMSLGDAIDAYKKSGKCHRTASIHLSTVKLHFSATLLGHMNQAFADRYVEIMKVTNSQRGTPFAMPTISRQFDAIRALLSHHAGLMGVEPPLSPFKKKTLGKGWEVTRERLLEDLEYPILLAEAEQRRQRTHWRLLIDLALETAAREGEMVLAEPKEFSLERRTWVIPAAHTKAKKQRQVPLSVKATAVVHELLDLLEDHKAFMSTQPPKKQKPMPNRLFYVFSSPSSVSTNFKKLTTNAKVEDLHFHDLRHTAITNMVMNKPKLTIKQIMLIVGHASEAMTDKYTHMRVNQSLVDAME